MFGEYLELIRLIDHLMFLGIYAGLVNNGYPEQ